MDEQHLFLFFIMAKGSCMFILGLPPFKNKFMCQQGPKGHYKFNSNYIASKFVIPALALAGVLPSRWQP